MEENKKSNSSVIIIIILSLLIILATGYVVYDKVFLTSNTNNNNTNNGPTDQTIKLTETEVKKIYYTRFNIDEKTLNEEILKLTGFDEIPSNIYSDKMVLFDNSYETRMGVSALRVFNQRVAAFEGTIKILISDVKKVHESIYGPLEQIKDFYNASIGDCKVDGDYLVCDTTKAKLSDDTGRIEKLILGKYYKFEETNDSLYIYEKIAYANIIYKDDGSEGEFHYFTDSNLKNEILELKGKSESALLTGNYDKYLTTYKYTFKKATNGTYYAYSIEPVK